MEHKPKPGWKPWKPPPEKRDRSEQQPKSRWLPTKNQLIQVTEVAAALLITVLVISMIWNLWRDVIRVAATSDYVRRGVLTVVGVLILIGVGYRFKWTGFGEHAREESETGEIQPRKTLWDWMSLLLVPIMIAGVPAWFTWWQNNSQQAQEERQQAQLAETQAQYSALQSYIDQMSQLIEKRDLRTSEETDVVFRLAQARTTTTIAQLDGKQNQILIRFLSGTELLRYTPLLAKVGLQDAELPKAELQEANLVGTQLIGANLAEAVLIGADFSPEDKVVEAGEDISIIPGEPANLTEADLRKAALVQADLAGCILDRVTLTKAALQGADLRGASLRDANLSYAALQYADLRSTQSTSNLKDAPFSFLNNEATNLTDANLSHANLRNADLSSSESIANLKDAPLSFLKKEATNLTDANVTNAALQDANLSRSVIQNANLTDANLTDANLTDAKGWTTEQLTAAASLEGATMPDGQTLKSDTMPHRPTFEEWLKDREKRKQDE